jgi:hypothetical protein
MSDQTFYLIVIAVAAGLAFVVVIRNRQRVIDKLQGKLLDVACGVSLELERRRQEALEQTAKYLKALPKWFAEMHEGFSGEDLKEAEAEAAKEIAALKAELSRLQEGLVRRPDVIEEDPGFTGLPDPPDEDLLTILTEIVLDIRDKLGSEIKQIEAVRALNLAGGDISNVNRWLKHLRG